MSCTQGDPSLVVVGQSLQTASRSSLQTVDQHGEETPMGGGAGPADPATARPMF